MKILIPLAGLFLLLLAAAPAVARDAAVPQSRAQIDITFAPIVRQVAPAVVNIYTLRTITRRYGHPFMSDPFFREFFGDSFGYGGGLRKEQVEGALGSGLILQEDGLAVTNAHVIDGADSIKVVLGDGREFDARIALIDAPTDLALLRIDTRGAKLPYARLRDSDTLEVGDLVLAIGNPFGVGQTVTSGIVSALSRSSLNISDYNFFIQTDAAINPGNSGGPLVAMDGGVVGINTAIYSRSGGSLGIGFAVPSEMLRAVIAAEKGESVGMRGILRPWVGASSQAVTQDIADSLGMKTPAGTLITDLHPASPLLKAGVRVGDVIVSMNGKAIRDAQEMRFRMGTLGIGDSVDLGILRKGVEKEFRIKTIAPPEDPPRQPVTLENGLFSGVTAVNINPAVAAEFDMIAQDETGVVVIGVDRNRAGARFFRPGDIIISINGTAIGDTSALRRAANARTAGWNLIINRNGQQQQIVIR